MSNNKNEHAIHHSYYVVIKEIDERSIWKYKKYILLSESFKKCQDMMNNPQLMTIEFFPIGEGMNRTFVVPKNNILYLVKEKIDTNLLKNKPKINLLIFNDNE